MRLVMMGTGSFAVPTFESLYATHHDIVALVTSPMRPHRSRSKIVTPMRDVAVEQGTPIHEPTDINSPSSLELLSSLQADLFVVCDYGYILSAQALATARLGGVNLHCSLLPKYRGAAPVNWTLYHGDTTTGVSVIHMTPKVDAGPVIAQSPPEPIDPEETADGLKSRLSEIGAWFVRRAIDSLEAGILRALPQDPRLASKAPKLKKQDGLLDWSRSAEQLRNQYRAMQPWPKTFTFWLRRGSQPLRVILGPLSVDESELCEPAPDPGTVILAHDGRLLVAAGDKVVEVHGVQPAGKRHMTTEEFLRGYCIKAGDRFGNEAQAVPADRTIPESVA